MHGPDNPSFIVTRLMSLLKVQLLAMPLRVRPGHSTGRHNVRDSRLAQAAFISLLDGLSIVRPNDGAVPGSFEAVTATLRFQSPRTPLEGPKPRPSACALGWGDRRVYGVSQHITFLSKKCGEKGEKSVLMGHFNIIIDVDINCDSSNRSLSSPHHWDRRSSLLPRHGLGIHV